MTTNLMIRSHKKLLGAGHRCRAPRPALGALALLCALPALPSLAHASDVANYPIRELSGDFNGDGRIDRVVTTPKADTQAGKIELFIGDGTQGSLWWKGIYHGSWPKPPRVITENDWIFNSSAGNYRRFGAGLIVGDFDNDGKDDLAFGAPGAAVDGNPYAGVAYVLYGKNLYYSNGSWHYSAATMYRQGGAGVAGSAEPYDYFGEFFAAGDFNCDGVDDLAIGVPRENLTIATQTIYDGGAVHVLYGSASTGITTAGDQYFAESLIGGTVEAYDYFGGALTAGRFALSRSTTPCYSLAVGVPGQNISGNSNAGAVYTLEGDPSGLILSGQMWHQDMTGVDGTTAAGEEFGARLGTRSRTGGDDLWVEIPGEMCRDSNKSRFQEFLGGSYGLTTDGDRRFCSRHDPGLADTEAGWLVEKRDSYGPYLQYLPSGVDQYSKVLVIVHGTPSALLASEDPWDHAARAARFWVDIQNTWIDIAERENLILIAPGFTVTGFSSGPLDADHPHNDLKAMENTAGGYRNLYGRDIQADAWVNLIVNSYKDVGLNPDGKLYIYGHSAGAQMVSRYLARNPSKLIAVAMSSPNTVAEPDGATWGYGLTALASRSFTWMRDDFSGVEERTYSYTPSESLWASSLTRPTYMNVGELEVDDTDSETHVDTAIGYLQKTDTFMSNMGMTSGVSLCIVQGYHHSYGAMHHIPAEQLFPTGNPPTCVAP